MRLLVVLSACCVLACTPSYRRCPEPAVPPSGASLPRTLSATGLYADLRAGVLAEGVTPFTPQFPLWSDGAHKRRWVWLPPGSTIDVRDPNAWQFPTGTKFWKEFTRDRVRVETRLLEKIGPNPEDWLAMAYVWAADGSDAVATPKGAVDAVGTAHDVPAARECQGCHGGSPSRVLGFGAIQLDHPAPEGEWTVATLKSSGRLHGELPDIGPVPGDAQTRAALGYLHGNCSHCHNQNRPPEVAGGRCFNPRRDFDLSLRVGELETVEATPTYRTAMRRLIVPGSPGTSPLYKRARGDLSQFQARMPPLATEVLDPTLLPMLEKWIRDLPH